MLNNQKYQEKLLDGKSNILPKIYWIYEGPNNFREEIQVDSEFGMPKNVKFREKLKIHWNSTLNSKTQIFFISLIVIGLLF